MGSISLGNILLEIKRMLVLDSKYRPFIFIFVLFVLFLIPVSVLEESPRLSVCSKIWGNNCYSVGITRGVSSLLKLDISQAIDYNWISIPTLGVMIAIIIYDLIQRLTKKRIKVKTLLNRFIL